MVALVAGTSKARFRGVDTILAGPTEASQCVGGFSSFSFNDSDELRSWNEPY